MIPLGLMEIIKDNFLSIDVKKKVFFHKQSDEDNILKKIQNL